MKMLMKVWVTSRLVTGASGDLDFGKKECPCIGVQGRPGQFQFQYPEGEAAGKGAKVTWPSDVLTYCNTWDDIHEADDTYNFKWGDERCDPAEKQEFCKMQWCAIDPCNCKIDGVKPLILAPLTYLGVPVYYSAHTCPQPQTTLKDAENHWSGAHGTAEAQNEKELEEQKRKDLEEQKRGCDLASQASEQSYGRKDCRCLAFAREDGRAGSKMSDTGNTPWKISDRLTVYYEGVFGASCKNWDTVQSECTGGAIAEDVNSKCNTKYCLVDKAQCGVLHGPLPGAEFNKKMTLQGQEIFHSTDTCPKAAVGGSSHALLIVLVIVLVLAALVAGGYYLTLKKPLMPPTRSVDLEVELTSKS